MTGNRSVPVGADNQRNLCASACGNGHGDVEGVLADCDYVVDAYLSYKGKPAGDDGNLPDLYVIWMPTED